MKAVLQLLTGQEHGFEVITVDRIVAGAIQRAPPLVTKFGVMTLQYCGTTEGIARYKEV